MPKRILQGTVTSAKNDQSVTVRVERRYIHPVMKKTVKRTKKYHAHDADNTFKEGDFVRIIECAPKSRTKRWEVMAAERS
jgi:small subunit ribosomal protein S17